MTLTPGSRLGPYQVLTAIGAGGMGEVYRARDTKLDRDVAIKVLPEHFVADADRVARFTREAKTLAALNHPNIAAIHGLEESNGVSALVLELVEGPTLADRIARGPIPLDEALPIARQIADALEAAHEHGIIHRDLKPANIKVREDGTVKVLDFGLAKALAGDPLTSPAALTNSPTLTSPLGVTGVGVLLGTAAYMSPEQAKGKTVDRRTDVWAFGCVVYEMLTGRRAFDGDDVTETLAAIIRGEPDWNVVPPAPYALRATLKACLRKQPRDRVRDVADVRLALEGAFADAPTTPPSRRTARLWLRLAPWGLAAIFGGLAIAALWWQGGAAQPQGVVRFTIPIQSRQGRFALAISPDGNEIVYTGPDTFLYAHALDQLAPTPIRGTEGAGLAFFSQDGKALAFPRGLPQLWTIPKQGGTGTRVCDCRMGPGAAWLSPETLVATRPTGELATVSAGGGEPESLTTRAEGEVDHRHPSVLPGGNLLFTIWTGSPETARVAAVRVRSKERLPLLQGFAAVYTRSGHLVFARADGSLWAAPFDAERITLKGEPVRVLNGGLQLEGTTLKFAISDNGTLTYLPSGGALAGLVWVDRNGQESSVVADRGVFRGPRISPDGTRIAVATGTNGLSDPYADERGEAIWVLDIARATRLRLTRTGVSVYPLWTPDGRRIAFAAATSYNDAPNDQLSIYSRLADGTGDSALLWRQTDAAGVAPSSWTRDGSTLAFWSLRRSSGSEPAPDRNIEHIRAGGQPEPLVAGPFNERGARFSPDGRWIAFVSNESGQDEIYVQPYPSKSGREIVSSAGGTEPVWSADSLELFYRPLDGDGLMVVPFNGQPQRARRLFNGLFRLDSVGIANYDVHPDGKRFIMVKSPERAPHIVVVLNWTEELKRLVPPK